MRIFKRRLSVFSVGSELAAAQTAGVTASGVIQQAPLNINQGVGKDNNNPKIFYSNPVAMAWRPNGQDAFIVVQQGDVVVRVTVDASGVPTINSPINAQAPGAPPSIIHADLQAP